MEYDLHAVLAGLICVDDAIGCAASGPDKQQDVFTGWSGADLVRKLLRALHWMPIHFKDHVAGSKTCILGRACRTHALNRSSVHLGWNIQLLAKFGRDVVYCQAKF